MAEDLKNYWATRSGAQLAAAMLEKKQEYQRFIASVGLLKLWWRMNRYFNGRDEKGFTTYQVGLDGDDDEISRLHVNHLRAIATRWLAMAKDARGGLQPIAEGDSFEAEEQQTYAKYLLDHYRFKEQIESDEDTAIEYSGLFGTGWLLQYFDPRGGQSVLPGNLGELGLPADVVPPAADATDEAGGGYPALGGDAGAPPMDGSGIAPPGGENHPLAGLNNALSAMQPQQGAEPAQAVFAGNLCVEALTPLDVFHEPRAKNTKLPWTIARIYRNKWDLAVQWPEFKDKIIELSTPADELSLNFNGLADGKLSSDDEIPVFVLLHQKSPSVPGGKIALALNAEILLWESTLPVEEPTIRAVRPAKIASSPWGYSPAWDALATQEAANVLSSIQLTNAKTFGVGSVIAPKGGDITPHQLAEGLNLIEYTPGLPEPKAMQFPTTPQEVLISRKDYISEMGINLGVNDTVRGMPEASLKSGSALALVQTQGVEHSKDFQRDIRRFCEHSALDTIRLIQEYVTEEEQIPILGEGFLALSSAISGESIKKVKRVQVATVNPLSMTLAGKIQIADTVADRFANQLRPGDYFRMLNDGNLDHLTKLESQAEKNIDRENELLAQGYGPPQMVPGPDGKPTPAPPAPGQKVVMVLATDHPIQHVKKHLSLLDNPSVRMGGPKADAIVKAVIGHIREHIAVYMKNSTTSDGLALLEIMGIPVLQAALPPAPPAGPAGPPPDAGGPPGDGPPPSAAKVVGEQNPAGKLPKMPNMPKLPAAT